MRGAKNTSECSRGFTLVELMVTVAVVAILAAIALPSYQQSVIRGKRSAAKAAMMDLANREQQIFLADRAYANTSALTSTYHYTLDADVSHNYGWDVTVNNSATPPTFTITFNPTGAQQSDGSLTLDSNGNKTPAAKWSR